MPAIKQMAVGPEMHSRDYSSKRNNIPDGLAHNFVASAWICMYEYILDGIKQLVGAGTLASLVFCRKSERVSMKKLAGKKRGSHRIGLRSM